MSKKTEGISQQQQAAATALQVKFNKGLALHQQGKLSEAETIYEEVLQQEPSHFHALYFLGAIAVQTSRAERAIRLVRQAIGLDAKVAAAHGILGFALQELNRPEEALASYETAIALKPDYADAYNNRGNALRDLKRPEEALANCEKAIALKPDYVEAYYNRGNALQDLKHPEEALASYQKAITLRPDYAEAYNNCGNALHDLKRFDEALGNYNKAIELKPDHVYAYNNRGLVLRDLKRPEKALASYEKAIALRPDYAEAYNNRGLVLLDLKRPEEALASYERAIALKPYYANAYNNRGNTLQGLKRFDEALASYNKAIELQPDHADAYNNRGAVLKSLKLPEESLASYEMAIALKPDYAQAYYNRGSALQDLKRPEEAFASYEKAIALIPDYAEAYDNRGNVLKGLKRLDEAFASYDKALLLNPDLVGMEGTRLHTKMHLCDWANFDTERAHLISSVKKGKANSTPFAFLGISSSPDDQLRCAKLWVAEKYPPSQNVIWQGERYSHDRIRIAYVSADFCQHPMSYLMAGVFEGHDRSRFEVTAISLGPDDHSELRHRLKLSFERFIDVMTFSDVQIASLVRSLEVDILVDLMGFTADSRLGILAARPAPIQVNYLGYPGTMGASYVDYIIADRIVIPEGKRECYSEKVIYLPDSFMGNDSKRKISERMPTRCECGLPETGFVFCAFNQSVKISPHLFDIWMRLLRKLDNSVLWLLDTNETAIRNLRCEAQNRGVDPRRLVFAQKVPLNEDHLARHRLANLFLDTLPYNAHATASDALWAGLPVLTYLGQTFAGSVAGSLLSAVGLPELVTTTPEAYEQKAIDLATHPEQLAMIKRKLAEYRLTKPLFDTKRFTNDVEAAYTAIHKRHQADLPPDHVVI
jgi:protein O-GlcNAc transferase